MSDQVTRYIDEEKILKYVKRIKEYPQEEQQLKVNIGDKFVIKYIMKNMHHYGLSEYSIGYKGNYCITNGERYNYYHIFRHVNTDICSIQ